MMRRSTPSSAQLVGGDLSVDVLHTEDSVTLGDETHKLVFTDVSATKCIPVDVRATTGATSANQTNGSQKTQIVNGADAAEFETVGIEKALKVAVISTVGGGSGGTAATDSATFTATATQFTPIGGVFDDVSSDALAEDEMGLVRLTSARAMHVAVQNSVAVTGTFWQATQPVSAASLPLPTGAATAALQTSSEALLTTIDADTGSIDTKLTTTNTNTGNAATSLAVIDDWDATAGSAHPSDGVMMMISDGTNARRLLGDSSGRPTVNINGTVPVSGTFWQATQPVSIASMPATPVTDNGGSLTVDGTVAATQSGTWNVGTVTTVTAVTSITNNVGVVGAAAHDAAVSGNPVMIGVEATNTDAKVSANGDVTRPVADLAGRLITQPFAPRERVNIQQTTITASTSETTVVSSAASTFHDLTLLTITNSSATGTLATLKDSTAGTTRGIWYIPATGGIVIPFPTPMSQATANNNWTITSGSSVSSLYVVAQYVKRV